MGPRVEIMRKGQWRCITTDFLVLHSITLRLRVSSLLSRPPVEFDYLLFRTTTSMNVSRFALLETSSSKLEAFRFCAR